MYLIIACQSGSSVVMDMRVRARLKCLFLYPKWRATYICVVGLNSFISILFEQLLLIRCRLFRVMLVCCCLGPKVDA